MGVQGRIRSLFKGLEEFDITEDHIGKPLFFLSMPIVVTNLFQTAYNLTDTFWLGQYSTDALAAISFAFPMVFLLISLGMGISVVDSLLVAQFTGADEERKTEYVASQAVTFAIIVSVFLGIRDYFGVGTFLSLLGASRDVLPMATSYIEVISMGLLVMFGSVVLNIITDPFLIVGWTIVENAPLIGTLSVPELGIQGAAIATVFSRSFALLVGLAIMSRGNRGVQIRAQDMVPDFSYIAYAWYQHGTWRQTTFTESRFDLNKTATGVPADED